MELLIAFIKAIMFFIICTGIGVVYEWGRKNKPLLTFVITILIILAILTYSFYI